MELRLDRPQGNPVLLHSAFWGPSWKVDECPAPLGPISPDLVQVILNNFPEAPEGKSIAFGSLLARNSWSQNSFHPTLPVEWPPDQAPQPPNRAPRRHTRRREGSLFTSAEELRRSERTPGQRGAASLVLVPLLSWPLGTQATCRSLLHPAPSHWLCSAPSPG